MSYRFRLYAPVDVRVPTIALVNTAGQAFATVTPQGTGQYCYDGQIDIPFYIVPQFASGYDETIVGGYYVNVDGTANEVASTGGGALFMAYGTYYTASDVQVRLELLTQETYYATLAFDANGGENAPSAIAGSMVNSNPYVRFIIPADIPTRPGYAFAGWNQQADGSGAKTFMPGDYFDGWGQTTSPGPTHWLYAQWTEVTRDVTALIYDAATGTWGEYTPIVYSGRWYQYDPTFSGG